MKESFAIIAAILAIIGNLPYLRDVIKGRVRPHPYTWLAWSIVSGIVFFGQLAKGAGIGVIPTAAAEVFTVIIFAFSLRYGLKGVTRTDALFLAAALLCLVPWALTDDPTLSVIIAVAIDLIAFAPTLRKTWLDPKSETHLLYGSNVARHALSLLSLQAYNIVTVLHSVVMITVNAVMVGIIDIRGKLRP